jgi:hypothetical protein
LDTTFTSVWLAAPPQRNFVFSPPRTAVVRRGTPVGLLTSDNPDATTYGRGWNRILMFAPNRRRAAMVRAWAAADGQPLEGVWGRGQLIRTPAFDVLVTARNWVCVGAVSPQLLGRMVPPPPASNRAATAGNPRPRRRGAR